MVCVHITARGDSAKEEDRHRTAPMFSPTPLICMLAQLDRAHGRPSVHSAFLEPYPIDGVCPQPPIIVKAHVLQVRGTPTCVTARDTHLLISSTNIFFDGGARPSRLSPPITHKTTIESEGGEVAEYTTGGDELHYYRGVVCQDKIRRCHLSLLREAYRDVYFLRPSEELPPLKYSTDDASLWVITTWRYWYCMIPLVLEDVALRHDEADELSAVLVRADDIQI